MRSILKMVEWRSRMGNSSRVAVDVPTVTAEDVCVHYGTTVALAPSSLTIPSGQSVALVGPNGSGKSTLLLVLAGLLRPTSGRVERRPGASGRLRRPAPAPAPLDADQRRRGVAHGSLRRARAARPPRRRPIAGPSPPRPSGWTSASMLRRPFGELSGGQRQRVLVAQALAAEPDLLLLDEPITGLDLASQQRILEVIAEETAAGTTVVLSTHHLGEARRTDRVLLLAGCVVADGPPERGAAAAVARRGVRQPDDPHGRRRRRRRRSRPRRGGRRRASTPPTCCRSTITTTCTTSIRR